MGVTYFIEDTMKKIIVLLGCSLFAFAGTAATAGCQYDADGNHAASPIVEGETPTDPKLLALLKNDEAEDQAKEVLQPIQN